MERRMLLIGGLGLLLLGLLGLPGPSAAQGATARVRFMHAAPDAPAVDVFVDGQAVLTNIAYPTIGSYLDVPAGEHQIAFAPTGQPASAALITADASLAADTAYTAIAVDEPAAAVELFEDDLSALAAGKARVRLIHMSPDAPGVDVEVIGGPTLFQGIGYKESSPYGVVDAGTYNLRAVAESATTVVVQLPNTQLQAGTIYDVIPAGRLANIQVQVATFTPPSAGAAESGAQSTLPTAGAESTSWLLIALGCAMVTSGLWLRRQARI